MSSLMGVHWIPTHGRNEDLAYMQSLNPAMIKIIDPDVQQISDVFTLVPNGLILLREHSISEQKEEMKNNPSQLAIDHANWWVNKINELQREALRREIPFPPVRQLSVCGINEPPVWEALDQTVQYTVDFLGNLNRFDLSGQALNLSVGWPGNTGEGTPPNWEPYSPIYPLLVESKHYLNVHEYWDIHGPNQMWGWWGGRIHHCPWQNINIVIGECGIDRYVAGPNFEGNRGWLGHLEPAHYAAQLVEYLSAITIDKRVKCIQPFTTDYGSKDWSSFDTLPAHNDILRLLEEIDPPPIEPPPVEEGDILAELKKQTKLLRRILEQVS